MNYGQVGQQDNLNREQFFTSGAGEDFRTEITRAEDNLNSNQNSWENSYQNQGNKAINATFEKTKSSYDQFGSHDNQVIDLTTKNTELTMPPVIEQFSSTDELGSQDNPEIDLTLIKTGEKLNKSAVEFIKRKNRQFTAGEISPEQFYNDARRLMMVNLENSYNRKIST